MDAKYLKITHNDHYFLKFKVNEVPDRYNSPKGEVDIFISIPDVMQFDNVCLSTAYGKRYFDNHVNNISWHGFYASIDEKIELPVIRLKKGREEIEMLRHTGTVNQKDVFLFPICSVHIPKTIDWNKLPTINKNEKLHKFELLNNKIGRIDFFVLPKIISIKQFMNDMSLSLYYFVGDITLFDKSKNGIFNPLPISSYDNLILSSVNISGWDVLVRILYTKKTFYPELDNTFSILLHDPNDAIEMLLNRMWAYDDEKGKLQFENIRERHAHELNIKITKNIK